MYDTVSGGKQTFATLHKIARNGKHRHRKTAPCNRTDLASLPPLGHGDVTDAHHHILRFAMNLLLVGRGEHKIDLEYINGLRWYNAMSAVS